MESTNLFYRFGIALVIGFLIGMQREFASVEKPDKNLPAGVRTFPLIAFIGCSAAYIGDILNSPLPFIVSLIVLGGFFSVNYFVLSSKGHIGLTTEISAILTCLIGGLAYWNKISIAAAIGVTSTVLLSMKFEMHQFVKNITKQDIYATLKFAVITAIVLPLLPNKTFGPEPFNIFNPFTIWLLVIFISGISFIGYILIKIVGTRKGIGLTGFLGGLASSTAVTFSFTQRSKKNSKLSASLALAIIISWTVMFSRVLIEVSALNISLLKLLWLPIVASGIMGLIYCVFLYKHQKPVGDEKEITFANPFELGLAIKFGLLYILILFIAKAGEVYLGNTGIYLSSFISGLADVDAISLSMAQLSLKNNGIEPLIAARAIVIATIANTFAKGLIIIIIGAASLRKYIIPGYLLMLATGSILMIFI